jgi:hypothetical protein
MLGVRRLSTRRRASCGESVGRGVHVGMVGGIVGVGVTADLARVGEGEDDGGRDEGVGVVGVVAVVGPPQEASNREIRIACVKSDIVLCMFEVCPPNGFELSRPAIILHRKNTFLGERAHMQLPRCAGSTAANGYTSLSNDTELVPDC